MKKNKRVIVLLCMLIGTIGISMAYFVGKTIFEGTGATTEARTATVNGTMLNVDGSLEFNDVDIYPGHQNLSKLSVSVEEGTELILYDLIWKGINGLSSNLKYTVYKAREDVEASITCEKKKKVENGKQYLYEECEQKGFEELGAIIGSGKIKTSEVEENVVLVSNEYIGGKEEKKNTYYVVLEYQNLDKDQYEEDKEKKFEGEVTVEGSKTSADIIIAKIYKKEGETNKVVDKIPTKEEGYVLDVENSKCDKNAYIRLNGEEGVEIMGIKEVGVICELYYKELGGES